ncbi:serine/threonine protein kinase [Leptolyngbya sp. FACHB-36]|uniref:serine/threonine-protein kinase n=1 Tax=Leptolyngbya sp. FACHB-36 TaxID=2692808 RepID=UPI00168088F0|nr:serine/threonine-protein kinase [Leptolyngbya sp. FACHB-36]MBD2020545.1 serine/threonine protein kinase [Leptolyngbya sp. FACHB-36]
MSTSNSPETAIAPVTSNPPTMPAPLTPGTVLQNRYRVVGVAGQGDFGQTYLARDQAQNNALCVLKEFTPAVHDPAALQTIGQRFQAAIAILHTLQHPQLPSTQTLIAYDQRFYWVRDYIEGKSYGVLLDERKAMGQTFSEAEVVQVLQQVLPVLNYLHNRGVIHRNLSLDSIIVRDRDWLPVLINFGLVKELVARMQLHPVDPNTIAGQWGYAPPEQLMGRVYPNSDLYALAVIAIALLTGKGPQDLYDETAQSFNWQQVTTSDPRLGQLLQCMLIPDPQKRVATAGQVMQLLATLTTLKARSPSTTVAAPSPTSSIQSAPAPKGRIRPRRRFNAEFLASAALITGLALLVSVVSWRILSSIVSPARSPQATSSDTSTNAPTAKPTTSPSTPSPSAVPSADTLRDRVEKLNLDRSFLTSLVDETFYAKNPQLKNRKPDTTQPQAEWNRTAGDLLEKLETLAPETRQKLGAYRRANYDEWLKQLGETGPSSRTLDQLADDRFFQLFPDLKGQTLNPRTYGQVWYAIAEEQLGAAKTQKSDTAQPNPEPSAKPPN